MGRKILATSLYSQMSLSLSNRSTPSPPSLLITFGCTHSSPVQHPRRCDNTRERRRRVEKEWGEFRGKTLLTSHPHMAASHEHFSPP